jgi:6-phosphogluconolactonase
MASAAAAALFRVTTTPTHLDAALGLFLCEAAGQAIAQRGAFVLCTSGGSMPPQLAAALAWAHGAGLPLRCEQWHVFYADERHVALAHADSNHAATLAALAARAPWFPPAALRPIDPGLPLEACAAAYGAAYAAATGGRGADAVLLGCGPDGHTASLFPGHALLAAAPGGSGFAAIADSPKAPPARVTLTLPALAAARAVAFVALGEGKARLVADIAAGTPEALALPAARVRAAGGQPPTWFLDAASASLLQGASGASS